MHTRNAVRGWRWLPGADSRWLILCDHASNRVPAPLRNLGLETAALQGHVAWDIGAADLARRLARHLRAPMIEHRVSRLVIDANRDLGDPSLMPESSDGIRVPGNQGLSEVEQRRRWTVYHQPYHRRIAAHLNQLHGIGVRPFLVSMHSFTPCLSEVGQHREWPVGVLWRDDPFFAHRLIRELGRDGLMVGDNKPYDGHDPRSYTMFQHAIRRGLPHVTIELRQDQLGQPAGRARWAATLYRALLRTVVTTHPHRPSGTSHA